MDVESDLDIFLNRIMKIRVERMGGASPGILGQVGTDTDLVNSLHRTAISFATEYRKSDSNKDVVLAHSSELEGFLQSLVLTNTLSGKELDSLLDQLYALTELV